VHTRGSQSVPAFPRRGLRARFPASRKTRARACISRMITSCRVRNLVSRSQVVRSRAHGCRGRSIKAERARRNKQPVIMHERRASSDSLSRYPPLIYSDKYGSFVCPAYSCALVRSGPHPRPPRSALIKRTDYSPGCFRPDGGADINPPALSWGSVARSCAHMLKASAEHRECPWRSESRLLLNDISARLFSAEGTVACRLPGTRDNRI